VRLRPLAIPLSVYVVHADLTKLGAKNESYSDVVRRLIDAYKAKK
jgi:predicted CopG family antitoxin